MQSLTNKKLSESYGSILIRDEATGRVFTGDGAAMPSIADSRTKTPYSYVPGNTVFGDMTIPMEIHNDSASRLGSMAFGYGTTVLARNAGTAGVVTNNQNPVGCVARQVLGNLGIKALRDTNPTEYGECRIYVVSEQTVDNIGVRYTVRGLNNIDGGASFNILQNVQPNLTSSAGTKASTTIGNSAGGGLTVWGNESIFSGAADGSINLGTASRRWRTIYASDGAIQTSDARLKAEVQDIDERVILAWLDVNLVQYKWQSAINLKQGEARVHIGLLAQHIKDIFEAHELDAFEYGLLCYDTWESSDLETQGDRWGVRMDECLWLEAAARRYRESELESRVLAIEEALNQATLKR